MCLHGKADNLISYKNSELLIKKATNKLSKGYYPENMDHNQFRFEQDLM